MLNPNGELPSHANFCWTLIMFQDSDQMGEKDYSVTNNSTPWDYSSFHLFSSHLLSASNILKAPGSVKVKEPHFGHILPISL
jgi:hypothetical protein